LSGSPSRFATAMVVLLCLDLAACIGATPLHRRTRSAQGMQENFTLDSIRIGETSRADVESKLKSFDAAVQSHRFLVARWSVSTWGSWAFACGYTTCVGTAGRHWSRRNLILEFDDKELVNGLEVFPDSQLVARLSRIARRDDPLDLSGPVQLHVLYAGCTPATIILGRDSFQFVEDGRAKKPYDFTIAADKVIGVGTSRIGPNDEASITEVIHFQEAP
jgi:hypothetical protein